MRAVAIGFLTVALMGSADAAWADEKQACVSAAETAQKQRSEGKLIEARASLLSCARAACPALVRTDCTKWLADNEASIPTLVVRAEDEHGRDVSDVRVELDGEPVAQRLDGLPLAANPGQHALTFHRRGSAPIHTEVIVQTGEKNRLVTVTLESEVPVKPPPRVPTPAPRPAPPVPIPEVRTSRSSPTAWVLTGLAAGAFTSFAYFGITGRSEVSRLRSECEGHCAGADVDAARNKLIIADVSLGLGVVSGALATLLFVRAARAELSVAPVSHGAFATWVEHF
jgi:hypothetical protein